MSLNVTSAAFVLLRQGARSPAFKQLRCRRLQRRISVRCEHSDAMLVHAEKRSPQEVRLASLTQGFFLVTRTFKICSLSNFLASAHCSAGGCGHHAVCLSAGLLDSVTGSLYFLTPLHSAPPLRTCSLSVSVGFGVLFFRLHMLVNAAFVVLCLVYFTQCDALRIHPRGQKWQGLLFDG